MSGMASVIASKSAISREQTFEGLVLEHKNRIFGYICRLTNDSPDAEDLTQEVFVRAYQSLNAFRNDAAHDTWLYRIATNLVIDRYRRIRRGPVTVAGDDRSEEVLGVASPDRGCDPQASLQLTELQVQVQNAIQSLPPKLRAAVVLYDLEGLPYEDIAKALGCPVGTVKSRIFNARTLLKRKLQHYIDPGM